MAADRLIAALIALASLTAAALAVPLPVEKPDPPSHQPEAGASRCLSDLNDIGVQGAAAERLAMPGQCRVADPIVLEAVETRLGTVRFPSRPILDCRFAAVLAMWITEVVSPIGASLLGAPVEAVVTGPGYQCRHRAGGRLSEHALGNAVDIAAIRLADGRAIPVEAMDQDDTAEAEFMRAVSTSACGYFTTVLGPGSDLAHARHLHVDLAQRTIPEFRICMLR